MFKEQMNRIKALIVRNTYEEGGGRFDKKKIENLVVFLIILIVTLIVINTILNGDKKDKNETRESLYKELASETSVNTSKSSKADELEERIEHILGTMSGVRQSKCFSYIFAVFRSCCNV